MTVEYALFILDALKNTRLFQHVKEFSDLQILLSCSVFVGTFDIFELSAQHFGRLPGQFEIFFSPIQLRLQLPNKPVILLVHFRLQALLFPCQLSDDALQYSILLFHLF